MFYKIKISLFIKALLSLIILTIVTLYIFGRRNPSFSQTAEVSTKVPISSLWPLIKNYKIAFACTSPQSQIEIVSQKSEDELILKLTNPDGSTFLFNYQIWEKDHTVVVSLIDHVVLEQLIKVQLKDNLGVTSIFWSGDFTIKDPLRRSLLELKGSSAKNYVKDLFLSCVKKNADIVSSPK